jgi:hypothetical protein
MKQETEENRGGQVEDRRKKEREKKRRSYYQFLREEGIDFFTFYVFYISRRDK